MLYCFLTDSPPILRNEEKAIDANEISVAHHGRSPDLNISVRGKSLNMRQQGLELCDAMQACCDTLDQGIENKPYSSALRAQSDKFKDPDATPSAIMLNEMRESGEGFFHLSKKLSEEHLKYFRELKLDKDIEKQFLEQSQTSLEQQGELEKSEKEPFDAYLNAYFAQK